MSEHVPKNLKRQLLPWQISSLSLVWYVTAEFSTTKNASPLAMYLI